MANITINNLADQREYEVVKTLRPGRVIINFDGLFVFADLTDDGWQRSQDPPSADDRAVLNAVIQANGGFDTTTTTVTKSG